MSRTYLTLVLLWIALGALAVDIELYKTDDQCNGDDFDFCERIQAGECCGSLTQLYESCQAIGEGIQAFSARPATNEVCFYLLGGSFECWGVSNDIPTISGCQWNEGSLKRAKRTKRTNPQEHGVGSNATEECIEPTHHGRRIGGKKYGMDMSRPEFEEYMNLTGEEEKNKFFVENADVVRDL